MKHFRQRLPVGFELRLDLNASARHSDGLTGLSIRQETQTTAMRWYSGRGGARSHER
jgi:hypothetical protein